MRDDEAAYAADKYVRHSERCATPVTVTLQVYGKDVIVSACKTRNLVADSTIPETVVLRTLS